MSDSEYESHWFYCPPPSTLDPRSLLSTLTDFTGRSGPNGDPSTLETLSLCDPSIDSSFTSAALDSGSASPEHQVLPANLKRGKAFVEANREIQVSSGTSTSTEYHSETSTSIASYEDASAFISRFISSPLKGNGAELNLLRALIIELESYVNVKEYVATRRQGQTAIRGILKPTKSALRREIRKDNKVPLQWVKQLGLQVLLVTCFS